jgi:DNA-binding transcriptional MerR regulator
MTTPSRSDVPDLPILLTPQEVADWFGINPRTLANWRSQGTGPPYRKLGHYVRYEEHELRAWLETTRRAQTTNTTAAEAAQTQRTVVSLRERSP